MTTANYYEPEINRTYTDLATHYGAIVLPARAAHPQDKPKVEVSVQIAQRWILAVLRHRTFFNAAIHTCLDGVNARPMQIVGVSRRALFEQLDRPALRPLPASRYELATWKPCRVNIDYHVEVDHNWYSVPYQLVHARVEARATATTVEVFLTGQRVASHARRPGRGRFATDVAHMPRAHRAHAEWTP
ncbi:MAG: IS21 family transposase, partial [Acidobacteriota bacterium]|nr:IS21 family transposase [Acidobacteriota bacterium]